MLITRVWAELLPSPGPLQKCRNEASPSRRDRRGSALVEFALLAPLLLLITAGTMEFSRVFYAATVVASAARAGVQLVVEDSANASNFTAIQNAALADGADVAGLTATASQFCQCSDGTTTSCGSGGCSSKRTYVQLLTSATFSTLGTYPMVPSSVILNGKAVVRAK